MFLGGYVQVSLGKYDISVTTGSTTTVDVSAEVVEKLKQTKKPVLLEYKEFALDGVTVGVGGYTQHTLAAGVHTHHIGGYAISAVGDSQIAIAAE